MAIKVYAHLSPRIIEVPAVDGTSITIQSLVDQIRAWEDEPPHNSFPRLLLASGKSDLGGGALTGITATLQDALVSFEARITPVSTGTVTTPDATGITLTDSGATFISDGVERGATILNFTDESVAEVFRVDSETQITCLPLRSGTDDQWDSSDSYKIWNIVQCVVTGGNLVSIDDVGANQDPTFNTAYTQVVIEKATSAALLNESDMTEARDFAAEAARTQPA